MRKILVVFSLLLLFLLTGLLTLNAYLAVSGPFQPGEALFPLQEFAENNLAAITFNPERRIRYDLDLLERRTADLAAAQDDTQKAQALQRLDAQLDRSLADLANLSPVAVNAIRRRVSMDLLVILELTDNLLASPGDQAFMLNGFHDKVLVLLAAATDPNYPLANLAAAAATSLAFHIVSTPIPVAQGTPVPGARQVDPHWVRFPPGSVGAQHAFFPLTGKHSGLDCFDCHTTGQYAGTPAQCQVCHASAKPQNHYQGECSQCHSTNAWLPATFNHQVAGATNCQSCHANKRPANHYQGQCSSCHSTSAWLPATFNHQAAGATDCQSCHANKRPANHYQGQCSSCHSTSAWLPATFNHQAAGATDCQTCHAVNRPANHYQGQCSSCHSTSAWRPATFNHQAAGATDCQTCHAVNRPANHYQGQCSSCHSTSAWRPATFNHQAAGATDCQSCHAGNRPANHFDGQCSNCHSTDTWQGATFDHRFPLNHGGANSVCATCHPSGTGSFTCFNCHKESELDKKHQEEGIPDYVARCMDCHADGKKHDD